MPASTLRTPTAAGSRILTAWCEHHGIPYQGVPVGTIKRHIAGKGNADKQAVIDAVRRLGFAPGRRQRGRRAGAAALGAGEPGGRLLMSDLGIFLFEQRTPVRLLDRDGEVWFVLNDVCQALNLANPRRAAQRLDDDEKGVTIGDTLGGQQLLSVVNEAGLYSLILTSRKAEARRFKRWVTHEVLPALRRTGVYDMRPV